MIRFCFRDFPNKYIHFLFNDRSVGIVDAYRCIQHALQIITSLLITSLHCSAYTVPRKGLFSLPIERNRRQNAARKDIRCASVVRQCWCAASCFVCICTVLTVAPSSSVRGGNGRKKSRELEKPSSSVLFS